MRPLIILLALAAGCAGSGDVDAGPANVLHACIEAYRCTDSGEFQASDQYGIGADGRLRCGPPDAGDPGTVCSGPTPGCWASLEFAECLPSCRPTETRCTEDAVSRPLPFDCTLYLASCGSDLAFTEQVRAPALYVESGDAARAVCEPRIAQGCASCFADCRPQSGILPSPP
jgi:hypothetical protein